MKGIDVYHGEGNINWDSVKSQIDFAILKLGNTGDNRKFWKDDSFDRNYSECKRLGIPVGCYVYSYTNSMDNIKEASRQVVNALKGKTLELPVYLDMEDDEIKNEGREKLTNMCIAFNDIIEQNGFKGGVYANKYWLTTFLNYDLLKTKYSIWCAQYSSKCSIDCDIWQYSESGRINGINTRVDMNIMQKDIINKPVDPQNENPMRTTALGLLKAKRDGIPLRSSKSHTDNNVITYFSKGTPVELVDRDGDWGLIPQGIININDFDFDVLQNIMTKRNGIPLRKSPSHTENNVITYLEENTVITVVEQLKNSDFVRCPQGYVNKYDCK